MMQYETVIGLEVHIELATKTKIFCGCKTDFGQLINTQVCPVCAGMPGTLPVLNRKVLEYGLALGLALKCKVNRHTFFDRKNYFYPDNPQNYQISQLYSPICYEGEMEIDIKSEERDNYKKLIRIHELHMEEDAGKLVHDEESGISLVDYNRAGVPLIEIVSEPDMSSADEVIAYLEKLRFIAQYLGISDCKLQEGSMRVDVNLSVRKKGTDKLGTRTEMKNLNSFKAIRHAIEHEKKRQIALIEAGDTVCMETRRWDDNVECSYSMRSKEDAKDYRYFPEPDLPAFYINEELINSIKKIQPEFRDEKIIRYKKEFKMSDYDASIITENKKMADIFETTVSICNNPKKVANWLIVETMRLLKEKDMDIDNLCFSPENLAKLINLVEAGSINSTVAKEVFEKVFDENVDPDTYVEEKGLKIVNDTSALEKVIEEVIYNNSQSVEDYRHGKDRALGFLVGQVMKGMKGKANPVLVNEILKEWLKG